MREEIARGERFSRDIVERLRADLAKALRNKPFAIVANGSYARGEASKESDLDYFLICDSDKDCGEALKSLEKIKAVLKKHVHKPPAAGGAFGQVESISGMTVNIGGPKDDNAKITRRILFLLEGEWLYNEKRFNDYRDAVLSKYLHRNITDHQFCRFLLNDLIRYYRTICVDFEHKTQEQGKAWGTRNIKLVFSRKLIYFTGILIAAESWQQTYEAKRQRVLKLLGMTPIQRVVCVCGGRAKQALDCYESFLVRMADKSVRAMLEKVSKQGKQPEEFRTFKNDGHHFSWMLVKLLKETYDSSHPIHNALVV
jgi:predicted nucleotidyltransferase